MEQSKKELHRLAQQRYRLKYPGRTIQICRNYRKRKEKKGLSFSTIRIYGFELALSVYEKYQRKCTTCKSELGLTIHHKDNKGVNYMEKGKQPNNSPDNLILLCRKCHGSIHGKQSQQMRREGKYQNYIGIPGQSWKKRNLR
jgi:hypothetical protein